MPIFFEKFRYENLKKTEISDIIYSESEKRNDNNVRVDALFSLCYYRSTRTNTGGD